MQEVVRFWVARGADGFRLDAIDRLAKDPELRDDPPSDEPFGLPLMEHELGRDLRYSRNAEWIGEALARDPRSGRRRAPDRRGLPARRTSTRPTWSTWTARSCSS